MHDFDGFYRDLVAIRPQIGCGYPGRPGIGERPHPGWGTRFIEQANG